MAMLKRLVRENPFTRLVRGNPFAASVLVLLVIVTPMAIRQAQEVERSRERAVQAEALARRVAELSASRDRERATRALETCQMRNLSLYRYRAMLRRFVEALAADSGGDRRTLALQRMVPADADIVDCNSDGAFDAADYGVPVESNP